MASEMLDGSVGSDVEVVEVVPAYESGRDAAAAPPVEVAPSGDEVPPPQAPQPTAPPTAAPTAPPNPPQTPPESPRSGILGYVWERVATEERKVGLRWVFGLLTEPVFLFLVVPVFLGIYSDLRMPLLTAEMLPVTYSQKSVNELNVSESTKQSLDRSFVTLKQYNVDRVVLAFLGPQGIGKTMTKDGFRWMCQNYYVAPTAQKMPVHESDTKLVSYTKLTVGKDDQITAKYDICDGLVISDIEGAPENQTLSEEQVKMITSLLDGTLVEGSSVGDLRLEARHTRGYTVVVPAILVNGNDLGDFDNTLVNQYKEIIKRVAPNKQPLFYVTKAGRDIPADELAKINNNFTALSERIDEQSYINTASSSDINFAQGTIVHFSPHHLTTQMNAPEGMMERFVEKELSVVFQMAADWARDMKKGMGQQESVGDALVEKVYGWWLFLITERAGKVLTRLGCLFCLALLVRATRLALGLLARIRFS